MKLGRIHSIETMGLLDGPGIRTVFFLQGCPLRCAYCHNPDSQDISSDNLITPQEVLEKAKKYRSYYKNNSGGVTFSGGEPLVQGEFLVETLKLLKSEGYHTVIDTSGYGQEKCYREILNYADHIILDIKSVDNQGYMDLTGKTMNGFNKFLSYLDDYRGTIWIRHVMVPSLTDNEESIYQLFDRIRHLSRKIDRIEILPYHKMGLEKYDSLSRKYLFKDISEMDKDRAKDFEEMLMSMLNEEKRNQINLDGEITLSNISVGD